jgi:hypothetical protein
VIKDEREAEEKLAEEKAAIYYIEVMDSSDRLAIRDGEPTSPNVMAFQMRTAPAPTLAADTTLAAQLSAEAPAKPRAAVRGRARKDRSKTR